MYVAITLLAAVFLSFWGWHKGILHLVLRLSSLLLAYALTWQEAPHLAHFLTNKGWLPGLLVWPAAGLLLFLGGSIIFSAFTNWLESLAPNGWHKSGKAMGGISGAVLGVGVGMLLVWTVGVLQDASQVRAAGHATENIQADVSEGAVLQVSAMMHADRMVRDLSGDVMAAVAQRALGDSGAAEVAVQWVRQPLSMSEGLQHLSRKPELGLLFQDPNNYAVLVHGSSADITRLPPFKALMEDPQVIHFLSVAGLQGKTLSEQSQALADMFSRYARNFEKLRSTQEFQTLTQDPELREKLHQGNLLALMTNDKMRQLVDMLVQERLPDQLPAAKTLQQHAKKMGETDNARAPSATPKQTSPSKPLYRWKDDSGRLHITERKPPEGVTADVIQP
jgi:hypothetical protein